MTTYIHPQLYTYYTWQMYKKDVDVYILQLPPFRNHCHVNNVSFQYALTSRQQEFLILFNIRIDIDPRRDDDASPMSSYWCMLRPT